MKNSSIVNQIIVNHFIPFDVIIAENSKLINGLN